MVSRRGTEIEFRHGDAVVAAYVATPHAGSGPGVVVIADDGRLGEFARDVCDRLARADFVALAPDLPTARGEKSDDADPSARERVVREELGVLDAAIMELFNQHGTDGNTVGALGFAFGGQLALALAAQNPRVGAVVDFYGYRADVEPDFATLTAPVLAIVCAKDSDEFATDRLEAGLASAGVRCSIQTRSDVRAGFMDDSRLDVHDAVAEFECWEALLAFFRAELP